MRLLLLVNIAGCGKEPSYLGSTCIKHGHLESLVIGGKHACLGGRAKARDEAPLLYDLIKRVPRG